LLPPVETLSDELDEDELLLLEELEEEASLEENPVELLTLLEELPLLAPHPDRSKEVERRTNVNLLEAFI